MKQQLEGGRRPFLEKGWGWIKLAAAAALCYPFFRFLSFQVPRKPRLEKVTQKLKVGDVYLAPEFALFLDKSKVWAVSRTCTHLGCRLNYSEENHLLICPCHQSKFTVDGKRIAGPAKRNLAQFPVEKMSGTSEQGYIVTL
ncbi:MAG: ubiquinol-cytochrome c reductase iron-sulfur subunit [Desulfobulbaceae bacterium]|nr:ubiquinol-cytochrome c reductase iron-sulfur subunit [Desulfobulbaceae bacterium]